MELKDRELGMCREAAVQAALEAGRLIRSFSGKVYHVEKKAGGSSEAAQVVTEVDRMSQQLILGILAPVSRQLDLGFLAEESEDDGSRLVKKAFWCIDPLDGTLPFTQNRPGYAVSIALVTCEGRACVGAVYDPVEGNLYDAAEGQGLCRNSVKWNPVSNPAGETREFQSAGAVINALSVLENPPAFFCKPQKPEESGGCLWDYAATACLFQEAGAWVSGMDGRPLDLNRKDSVYLNHQGVLYASNAEIAKHLLVR